MIVRYALCVIIGVIIGILVGEYYFADVLITMSKAEFNSFMNQIKAARDNLERNDDDDCN
jgi:hypothetical protein